MTLPVIERIAQELISRIEAGGIPDARVVRPARDGRNYTKTHGTIVMHQLESIYNQQLSHEGNPPAIAYDVVFNLFCFIREVPAEAPEYATACNVFASDVARAINNPETSPSTWHTFGDNAINANVGSFSQFVDNDATAGVLLPIQITYRVSETDHTVARV